MRTKAPEEIELPEIVEDNALDLYNGNRIRTLIEAVRQEVASIVLDPSDPKDHKHFGSIQRRISSFKVALDAKGQEIVKPIKKQILEVDELRKYAKDSLDRIRADFLAPRDEHDAAIAARAKVVNDAFELFLSGWKEISYYGKPKLKDWQRHLARIDATELDADEFGERYESAIAAKEQAIRATRAKIVEVEEEMRVLEAGRKALAAPEGTKTLDDPETPAQTQPEPPTAKEMTSLQIQAVGDDICNVSGIDPIDARLIAYAIGAGSIRGVAFYGMQSDA